jgi:hypothetical protein
VSLPIFFVLGAAMGFVGSKLDGEWGGPGIPASTGDLLFYLFVLVPVKAFGDLSRFFADVLFASISSLHCAIAGGLLLSFFGPVLVFDFYR